MGGDPGGRAGAAARLSVSLIVVLVARVPVDGVELFDDYERHVLPLLADHGAALERRLRSADRCAEVHLVSFPTPEAFAAYRADPRRVEHAPLLAESKAVIELFEFFD